MKKSPPNPQSKPSFDTMSVENVVEHKSHLPSHPHDLFNMWFEEAHQCADIDIPESFHLATANKQGAPHCRVLLLKGHSKKGFVFFTNSHSMKGHDLAENNQVSMNFYWQKLGKQIRVRGKAFQVSDKDSDTYFASRPRGSQIGAWASEQSHVIPSRDHLNNEVEKFTNKFDGKDVPRPAHWFGFLVEPESIEFWMNREDRLHDRFLYEQVNKRWAVKRIAP